MVAATAGAPRRAVEVKPGNAGGCEMQAEARMAQQPVLDRKD
jgi:hypothetical protein